MSTTSYEFSIKEPVIVTPNSYKEILKAVASLVAVFLGIPLIIFMFWGISRLITPKKDPVTPTCPYGKVSDSNGNCVECVSSSDCMEGKVCNARFGNCVECMSPSDCMEGKVCNANGACVVECVSSSDCMEGKVCNANGNCVECISSSDCMEGKVCDTSSNYCVLGQCMVNGECPENQACDTPSRLCGNPCITASDCMDSEKCSTNGVCIPYTKGLQRIGVPLESDPYCYVQSLDMNPPLPTNTLITPTVTSAEECGDYCKMTSDSNAACLGAVYRKYTTPTGEELTSCMMAPFGLPPTDNEFDITCPPDGSFNTERVMWVSSKGMRAVQQPSVVTGVAPISEQDLGYEDCSKICERTDNCDVMEFHSTPTAPSLKCKMFSSAYETPVVSPYAATSTDYRMVAKKF